MSDGIVDLGLRKPLLLIYDPAKSSASQTTENLSNPWHKSFAKTAWIKAIRQQAKDFMVKISFLLRSRKYSVFLIKRDNWRTEWMSSIIDLPNQFLSIVPNLFILNCRCLCFQNISARAIEWFTSKTWFESSSLCIKCLAFIMSSWFAARILTVCVIRLLFTQLGRHCKRYDRASTTT